MIQYPQISLQRNWRSITTWTAWRVTDGPCSGLPMVDGGSLPSRESDRCGDAFHYTFVDFIWPLADEICSEHGEEWNQMEPVDPGGTCGSLWTPAMTVDRTTRVTSGSSITPELEIRCSTLCSDHCEHPSSVTWFQPIDVNKYQLPHSSGVSCCLC